MLCMSVACLPGFSCQLVCVYFVVLCVMRVVSSTASSSLRSVAKASSVVIYSSL